MLNHNHRAVAKSKEARSDRYLSRLKAVHVPYDRAKVRKAIIVLDGDFNFKTPFPMTRKREPKEDADFSPHILHDDALKSRELYTKPTYLESIIIRDDSKCNYCTSNRGLLATPLIFLQDAKRYCLRKKQLTNPGNLVTACHSCVNKRNSRPHEEFLEQYPEYAKNFSIRASYVSQIIREKLKLDELLKEI